jgi:cell division protein FtsQ
MAALTRNRYTRPPRPGRRERKQAALRNGTAERGTLKAGNIIRWTLGILVSCAVLFGVMAGLLHVYHAVTTSQYFTIRKIEVNGINYFSRDAVLETIGMREGMNSFSINIEDIEGSLRKTPWVKNVSVTRNLPDGFTIDIEERMPAFWITKDDTLLYVDSNGDLIAPVETHNFLSLPSLELEHGGEMLLDKLEVFVNQLKTTSLPLEVGNASWLRLSAARGFELFLEKHGLTISIGTDDWEKNLRRLGMVLHDLAARGEIRTAIEIWSADGKVWVRRNEKK